MGTQNVISLCRLVVSGVSSWRAHPPVLCFPTTLTRGEFGEQAGGCPWMSFSLFPGPVCQHQRLDQGRVNVCGKSASCAALAPRAARCHGHGPSVKLPTPSADACHGPLLSGSERTGSRLPELPGLAGEPQARTGDRRSGARPTPGARAGPPRPGVTALPDRPVTHSTALGQPSPTLPGSGRDTSQLLPAHCAFGQDWLGPVWGRGEKEAAG